MRSAISDPPDTQPRAQRASRPIAWTLTVLGASLVLGVLCWQGLFFHGAPDPVATRGNELVSILNVGVLVFREGLECILVLSALTASMVGKNRGRRGPIAGGAVIGFGATIVTWFVAVGIVQDLTKTVPALDLQAGTGLLAVLVLLVVMNWFFHKVYWGGWISHHNRTKKSLLRGAEQSEISERRLVFGLGLLGFASLYREGFEVVLFLQSYNLQMGGQVVLWGSLIGLGLSLIVGLLTFVAHRKLPYRRMLVVTGVLLGFVLLVMVGEQAQEMQLANWIPTTKIGWLDSLVPDWMGVWFSIFPTWETLTAQFVAALLVVGSYFMARRHSHPPGTAASA